MTRFTEIKYLSRLNKGNYEHDECQITAVIGENDSADEVIAFTKLKVQQALNMTFSKASPVKQEVEEEVKEEPKKAAKKTTKSLPKKQVAVEVVPEEEVKEYTLEQVKTALASVWKAKGKQVAVEILGSFNVAKSDELTPKQYSSVVAECEKCTK